MIATEVDLCNLALANLGDEASVSSISPSDGSMQADHCARFYGPMRDWLMERFPWKFGLRRAPLAERADLTFGSWAHAYEEPADCIRILSVLPGTYTLDNQGQLFETESDEDDHGLILTNAADAVARFIARVTDTTKFTPGFTETLGWFLAAKLAGPIIKGETGRQEAIRCIQMGAAAFSDATGLSARQAKTALAFVPVGIASRGGADMIAEFTDVIGDTGGFPIRG